MKVENCTRRRLLIAGSRLGVGFALLTSLPSLRAAAEAEREPQRAAIVALAFDPVRQTLFKASTSAISLSSDGGHQWSPVAFSTASTATSLTSIAVPSGAAGALYVAGHGIGVLRSDDGGSQWSPRNEGLPSTNVDALTTHADQPETVYAYLIAHGIFRSEDGGRHWRLMDAGPRGGITTFVHSNMPGSMQSGWFFVAGTQGVRRAMDCFCGWRDAGQLGRAVRTVAFDPRRPSDIFAAVDASLFFSDDGGEKWSKLDGPESSIDAMVVTPRGEIYAAGSNGSLFVGAPGAASWRRVDA